MITKITINNTASYKEETSLETDKKVNLIYGLNGSGKTVLSEYLKNIDDEKFQDCSVEGFDKEKQKILVYNQKFIEENFYESENQKGIFTVAKENKEALQVIEKAKVEKQKLEEKLENEENGLHKKLQEKEQEIQNNVSQAQEKTWKIKQDYTGGDRVFDNAGFLYKLKIQKNLFNYLKKVKLEKPTKTIDEIKKELQELGEGATSREEIPSLEPNDYTTIEQEGIFEEEIIGNQNSTVSDLIKELKNSDWVKKGLEYVDLDKRRNCPFCQQETITGNLVTDIESYFDKTYEEKTKKLLSLKDNYQKLKTNLVLDNYKKDFFTREQHLEIKNVFSTLDNLLKENLTDIERKINHPSTKIKLQSSQPAIKDINTWIEEINKEIEEFNQKLENRDKTIKELKDEFWKIQRKEYNITIVQYQNEETKLTNEKEVIEKSIEATNAKIKEQEEKITDNLKKITNIEQTIEAINKHLLDFGIQEFKIMKHEENTYKIQRGEEQQKETFKSLSEGEKTVISFLYFIELCKGQENQTDIKEKIIVIDDPISSLSHMYVFNVAQLIKSTFFREKKNDIIQCFVLTHSLYFFHELVDKNDQRKKEEKNKKQKLFRITKANTSKIEEMKQNEIQNEYESYWHIVNTATEENKFIIANAMRNIIEHFFGFVEKEETINNIFQKEEFKENKYQAFKRYIDRESHSDRTNINDSKEFNFEIFKEAFEQVFVTAGYKEHYEKYLNLKEKE